MNCHVSWFQIVVYPEGSDYDAALHSHSTTICHVRWLQDMVRQCANLDTMLYTFNYKLSWGTELVELRKAVYQLRQDLQERVDVKSKADDEITTLEKKIEFLQV